MTSYGYIIGDSCIIAFNLKCIMQWKQVFNIAIKVSSRKKCYYFFLWSTWLIKALCKNWFVNWLDYLCVLSYHLLLHVVCHSVVYLKLIDHNGLFLFHSLSKDLNLQSFVCLLLSYFLDKLFYLYFVTCKIAPLWILTCLIHLSYVEPINSVGFSLPLPSIGH